MKILWEWILEYFKNYVSKYSYFVNKNYYLSLFSKYFSIVGFITGFIFLLLMYFASVGEQKKARFIKVFLFVAVINNCMMLFMSINSLMGSKLYEYVPGIFGPTDNIISGFMLTLVIISCYKGYDRRAFFLGIVTYAAIPLLNFEYLYYFSEEELVQMLIRIVIAGILCLIISHRKYFYTSWIWYFGFHFLIRILVFLTPMFSNLIKKQSIDNTRYTISKTLQYFASFRTDYILFVVIFVFAVIFERVVISTKPEKGTT